MAEPAVQVESGVGAPTIAMVVVGSVVTAVLLIVPVLLMLFFSGSFMAGSTCSVGFQPFCTPGYGLPQLYAVLVVGAAAVAALLVGIVAAIRGRARRARVLVLLAVGLALLALLLVGARAWLGWLLPADWFVA